MPDGSNSYHVTREEAQSLTKSKQGFWKGPKQVLLVPDRNLKVSWCVKQSGKYGPLVLQIVT